MSISIVLDSEASSNVDRPHPPETPARQPGAAGRVVLMGVLAVNTLKRAVVGAVRARENERERVEGRTSGALCVESVYGGDNETERERSIVR